jgi:hypothetical protein
VAVRAGSSSPGTGVQKCKRLSDNELASVMARGKAIALNMARMYNRANTIATDDTTSKFHFLQEKR